MRLYVIFFLCFVKFAGGIQCYLFPVVIVNNVIPEAASITDVSENILVGLRRLLMSSAVGLTKFRLFNYCIIFHPIYVFLCAVFYKRISCDIH